MKERHKEKVCTEVGYRNLTSEADRGSHDAQKRLMELGQQAQDAGDFAMAAKIFKDAAIAYRIAASRTGGLLADSNHNSAWLFLKTQYYEDWIKQYTQPSPPRIECLRQHNGNFNHQIITMWRNEGKFRTMLRYLEKKLMEHGIEFCAPGGTINRHFYHMVNQHEAFTGFLNDIDIRIVLDPICDEVMDRIQGIKNEPIE